MRNRSAFLLGVVVLSGHPKAGVPPVAQPNDNRTPAGVVTDSGVTIDLEARRVMWHPDGDSLPGRSTEAFGEAGKPPSVPGPLVRVRAGTPVRIRVHNADIPDTITFLLANGLNATDTARIAPGWHTRGAIHAAEARELLLSRDCEGYTKRGLRNEGTAGRCHRRRFGLFATTRRSDPRPELAGRFTHRGRQAAQLRPDGLFDQRPKLAAYGAPHCDGWRFRTLASHQPERRRSSAAPARRLLPRR